MQIPNGFYELCFGCHLNLTLLAIVFCDKLRFGIIATVFLVHELSWVTIYCLYRFGILDGRPNLGPRKKGE